MEILGHIENGVVVLDGGSFPEGTRVSVTQIPVVRSQPEKRRVDFPLVRDATGLPTVEGGEPGSVNLTNAMIHEILNEEEDAKIMRQWNVPS